MKNKNFFYILYSVCSSTKIFKDLSSINYIRAFWHLIIIIFLCSVCFALINISHIKTEIAEGCSVLQTEFGGISVEKTGVYPVLKKEKARKVNYQYTQIDYIPTQSAADKLDLNTDLYTSGVIWSPTSSVGWIRFNNNQIIVYPVLTSPSNASFFAIIPKDEIVNYIKQLPKISDTKNLILRVCTQGDTPIVGAFPLKSVSNFEVFAPYLLTWSLLVLGFTFFASVFFNVVFYSVIFALIYRFAGKVNYYNFTFKNFFIIAMYAAFPAMIIGTLLSLAKPQWFDYVFIITFVVYLFVILNNIRKSNSLERGEK